MKNEEDEEINGIKEGASWFSGKAHGLRANPASPGDKHNSNTHSSHYLTKLFSLSLIPVERES